jgi:starch synthase
VLLAASEVVGFAKTGGLADVAGTLPVALARRGHQCAVLMPLYHACRKGRAPLAPTDLTFQVPVAGRAVTGRLWQSTLPGSSVPLYLVEQPGYFERDDPAAGRGLYQEARPDGSKHDYPDNCERFAFFNRAILEAARLLDFWPDVLHVNDWQTALAPVYLREVYRPLSEAHLPGAPGRPHYDRIRTLLTIHNIAFQGVFWHYDMALLGLDWRLFNDRELEFHGHLNFLKGGIVFANLINTVSPTYAREVQTPYYGCGLQGVLTEHRAKLSGIVNGVDYGQWSPEVDAHLPARYSADALAPGKPACKSALQRRFGLREAPDAPLFGVVARLTEQKGVDLIGEVAPALLRQGAQLVVLGEGEPRLHHLFERLRDDFPGAMGLLLGFNEPLAHLIEAGSDLFLMPSLYEPSGLNQLYSMRYGTPPVVRATGGLADTVVDTTPATLADGTATGFRFAAYSGEALFEAIQRALTLFRDDKEGFLKVVRNGMRQDWSWDRSAAEYEKLYQRLRHGYQARPMG